jgi:hypothetical protein
MCCLKMWNEIDYRKQETNDEADADCEQKHDWHWFTIIAHTQPLQAFANSYHYLSFTTE